MFVCRGPVRTLTGDNEYLIEEKKKLPQSDIHVIFMQVISAFYLICK